jgi:nuclear transport factor 2 (NTF2) superfamily protein
MTLHVTHPASPPAVTETTQPKPAQPSAPDETGATPQRAAEPGDRTRFFSGYDAVRAFVIREWERELDYRLKKELWTYAEDRVSVRFEYEWRDADTGDWLLTRGEEQWVIGRDGLIRCEDMSTRDYPANPLPR